MISCSSGFSTAGVESASYTSFTYRPQSTNGSFCTQYSTASSLATPFFVPTPTGDIVGFISEAATSFQYDINPSCIVLPYETQLSNFVTILHLPRSNAPNTHSSTSFSISTAATLSTARAIFSSPHSPQNPSTTTATSLSTLSPPSPSTSSTETRKLIIGLVVAIVVAITLVALSLVYFTRRRWRRK